MSALPCFPFWKSRILLNQFRFLRPGFRALSTFRNDNSEINRLISGHQRFRSKYFLDTKNTLYQDLTKHGQKPKTMVIACSDSRVDPAIILDSPPGSLFIVRNVANLVPPYVSHSQRHHGNSAALEFAVQTLKVQHIIVLGHSHCGGIRALLQNTDTSSGAKHPSFITTWMQIVGSARDKVLSEYQDHSLEEQSRRCEEESLLVSLKNLETFPWIDEKVQSGLLALHAWHFDLQSGIICRFDASQRKFEPLTLEDDGEDDSCCPSS